MATGTSPRAGTMTAASWRRSRWTPSAPWRSSSVKRPSSRCTSRAPRRPRGSTRSSIQASWSTCELSSCSGDGISIEDATWDNLRELAQEFGLDAGTGHGVSNPSPPPRPMTGIIKKDGSLYAGMSNYPPLPRWERAGVRATDLHAVSNDRNHPRRLQAPQSRRG